MLQKHRRHREELLWYALQNFCCAVVCRYGLVRNCCWKSQGILELHFGRQPGMLFIMPSPHGELCYQELRRGTGAGHSRSASLKMLSCSASSFLQGSWLLCGKKNKCSSILEVFLLCITLSLHSTLNLCFNCQP